MLRPIRLIAGILLIMAGALLAPSPIPVGLPVVTVGLFLLLSASQTCRRWLRNWRDKYPRLDGFFRFTEKHAQGKMRRTIKKSRPKSEDG